MTHSGHYRIYVWTTKESRMLDSRFRQAANRIQISFALIAFGTWSHVLAQHEPEAYFFDGIEDEVVEHLCSDQHFLNTAELGAKACEEAIDLHVEECWDIVEQLEPELFVDGLGFSLDNTQMFGSLMNVFVMCLQSQILLSKADDI